MTLSVRLPHRVEEKLAEYCVEHGATKSAVVQSLIEDFLAREADAAALPAFVGCDEGDGADISGTIRQRLRERFRPA